MEAPPPPYSAAPQNEIFASTLRTSVQTSARPLTAPDNYRNNIQEAALSSPIVNQIKYRFPRSFGLYHAADLPTDYVIAYHADDHRSLFYISSHVGASSQPSLVLHTRSHPSSSPLATADLHFLTQTVAISLYDSPISVIKAQSAKTSNAIMTFIVRLPDSDLKEQFAWRNIQGRDRILPGTKINGMKLVNCATGESVATWTKAKFSYKKIGRMNFLLEDRSILGERFELMAVVTLLSILEKEKRKRSSVSPHGYT